MFRQTQCYDCLKDTIYTNIDMKESDSWTDLTIYNILTSEYALIQTESASSAMARYQWSSQLMTTIYFRQFYFIAVGIHRYLTILWIPFPNFLYLFNNLFILYELFLLDEL